MTFEPIDWDEFEETDCVDGKGNFYAEHDYRDGICSICDAEADADESDENDG